MSSRRTIKKSGFYPLQCLYTNGYVWCNFSRWRGAFCELVVFDGAMKGFKNRVGGVDVDHLVAFQHDFVDIKVHLWNIRVCFHSICEMVLKDCLGSFGARDNDSLGGWYGIAEEWSSFAFEEQLLPILLTLWCKPQWPIYESCGVHFLSCPLAVSSNRNE